MGKNKNRQKSGQKARNNSANNKNQKLFKVASDSKKGMKKTKEIPKKLKQLDLKTKDKADQQLKDLHLKLVSKKEVKPSKAVGKKAPAPSTEKVQDGLNNLNVE